MARDKNAPVRVDRPDEGLPGVATVGNPTANPPSRASFQAEKAGPARSPRLQAVIDTSDTARLTQDQLLKRAKPAAWA